MNGRATVQKSVDTWNKGDREAWFACYTDDCEITSNIGTDKGQAALAAYWAAYKDPYPGSQVRVEVLIEVGDTVAEEAVVTGTNSGPMLAPDGSQIPATGRDFTLPFAALHTVDHGKHTGRRAGCWHAGCHITRTTEARAVPGRAAVAFPDRRSPMNTVRSRTLAMVCIAVTALAVVYIVVTGLTAQQPSGASPRRR